MLPMSAVRACGGGLGRAVYLVDGFHRRIALDEPGITRFPTRSAAERRAVARAMFAHFGRLLLELIKFGTLSDAQMLARIDIEGEERVLQAYQHGRGVLFFTGHFGYWEMQAIAHPLRVRPVSVLARPLDNPYLHEMLEQHPHAHRQRGDLSAGRDSQSDARARGESRCRDADRSASAFRRCGVRGLLRSAGGYHLRACRARAAHRRAGDSGVRAAAAGRPLPLRLRTAGRRRRGRIHPTRSGSSRSAAPTCSRCTCAAIRRCGCGCIGAGAIATRGSPAKLPGTMTQ